MPDDVAATATAMEAGAEGGGVVILGLLGALIGARLGERIGRSLGASVQEAVEQEVARQLAERERQEREAGR